MKTRTMTVVVLMLGLAGLAGGLLWLGAVAPVEAG